MIVPAQWNNKEIRMLHILGAIIGAVIGLVVGLLSSVVAFEFFPWKLVLTTGSLVGALIGAFNRAPLTSCLAAFLVGALLGIGVGVLAALALGTLLWVVVGWLVTAIPGMSISAVGMSVTLGALVGPIVIDPRLWLCLCSLLLRKRNDTA